jgi:hypothetical protein
VAGRPFYGNPTCREPIGKYAAVEAIGLLCGVERGLVRRRFHGGRLKPMIPSVCRLARVEMLRDGGSLTASFENESSARYILLIPIHMSKEGALGYRSPVLIDCDPKKRPSNTDGVFYSELCGPDTPISWAEARIVVEAIAQLAAELGSRERQLLNQMTSVVATEGRLPTHPSDNG